MIQMMDRREIYHLLLTIMSKIMKIEDRVDPRHILADFLWNSSVSYSVL